MAIRAYQAKQGKYPDNLYELNVKRSNLLVFFHPGKIHMMADQGKVRLYYTEFPLGPAHVYDLATRSWGYEEI